MVHEWGTFTSFSGSDGGKLEFRPLVDNDLPSFVLNRWQQAGLGNMYSKSRIRVLQRMETPITYFYTERERDVRVSVGFPEGLLTEFYPPVDSMLPAVDPRRPTGEKIGDSMLDWGTVHLIPTDRLATSIESPELRKRVEHEHLRALLPGTRPLVDTAIIGWGGPHTVQPNQEHYLHARETDSALVHVRRLPDVSRAMLPTGDFFEKFLFYRGVGNFDLPLEMTAEGNDAYTLRNEGPDAIRRLFLVTVEPDTGRGGELDEQTIRYTTYDGIDPKSVLSMRNDAEPSDVESLSKDVVSALVAEGLYEKEAVAMVKTWKESWFGEAGTRLFYVVPNRVTDALLPLRIDPVPDEVVRVLVGRLEVMSPEDEQRVEALVRESITRRAALHARSDAAKEKEPFTDEMTLAPMFENLGRLAEPGLVRVKVTTKDAAVRGEAATLLYELSRHIARREAHAAALKAAKTAAAQ